MIKELVRIDERYAKLYAEKCQKCPSSRHQYTSQKSGRYCKEIHAEFLKLQIKQLEEKLTAVEGASSENQ